MPTAVLCVLIINTVCIIISAIHEYIFIFQYCILDHPCAYNCRWKLVDWILYRKQKDDILCWFLSTAFICKAAKKWEKDTQIMKEYRAKQE